ncbi:MAG: ParB/RepB/Spo0J family partition protein [Clostridia bacterium]
MKNLLENTNLNTVDDLFTNEEARQDEKREKVTDIPLDKLHPFANHPFKVLDDEKMQDTVESVLKYGVLMPAIARPLENGEFEIIAGHRRHRASELAGLATLPVIVRDLDDDAATIIMVDSNLQRENILPSERAFAFKLKLEAMKRQGNRSDLTSSQVGTKLRSDQILAEQVGESRNQVQRYIRLTNLVKPMLDMVDDKIVAFNPAVELSYLKPNEQEHLVEIIEEVQATPSLSQAIRLKKYSAEDKLSKDVIHAILSEEKKPEVEKITFKTSDLKKYFPKDCPSDTMEKFIIKLLGDWHQKQVKKQKLRQQTDR